MCHELRTPFHGVMGCLNILHEAIDDMSSVEIKDMIQTSIETGNHMVHLLNDILTQSKNRYISASKARDKVVYADFATQAVEAMKSLAANSHVYFTCDVGRNNENHGLNSHIVLDRTKTTQIITNSKCVCAMTTGMMHFEFSLMFVFTRRSHEQCHQVCRSPWSCRSQIQIGNEHCFRYFQL